MLFPLLKMKMLLVIDILLTSFQLMVNTVFFLFSNTFNEVRIVIAKTKFTTLAQKLCAHRTVQMTVTKSNIRRK